MNYIQCLEVLEQKQIVKSGFTSLGDCRSYWKRMMKKSLVDFIEKVSGNKTKNRRENQGKQNFSFSEILITMSDTEFSC